MRSWRRSRAGQIVIPTLLIFPTLFLFVYLIYETAKLSREKIRHQFAMDAAAFVEMTNYSDFLNRSAYVNGAFPMRIFEEGYGDFMAECEGKTSTCKSDKKAYAELLWKNGAYPRSKSGQHDFPAGAAEWDIEYAAPREDQFVGGSLNRTQNESDKNGLMLFTLEDAEKYYNPWAVMGEIYKLYVQIYSLLGSVEDSQYTVLKKLVGDHSFMRKSYWLNTGDNISMADGLVASFRAKVPDFTSSVNVRSLCQPNLYYWGNVEKGGIRGPEPTFTSKGQQPADSLGPTAGCSSGGLFQAEWVNPSAVKDMKAGIELSMNWAIPAKNFFNVPFAALLAQDFPNGTLHTTISVSGDPNNKPAVYPHPTPKFQVRQTP